MCTECESRLRYIGAVRCMKCGKGLPDDNAQYCYDCERVNHDYTQAAAAFVYNDEIKKSIYAYKYKGKRVYSKWYARKLFEKCGMYLAMWKPDVIVPIPLHPDRQRKRGYNQAELLANELSALTGIKVDTNYLLRTKNTKPLKTMDNVGRIKNLEKAFIVNENSVKYNKIMLIDDIYTTGATFDACARVLKSNGAEYVYGISLCVGKGI